MLMSHQLEGLHHHIQDQFRPLQKGKSGTLTVACPSYPTPGEDIQIFGTAKQDVCQVRSLFNKLQQCHPSSYQALLDAEC